jgi:FkbM family methyltransferase
LKIHHNIAALFGYELIKRRNLDTLNQHLENVLKKHRINCIIDVGANTGQYGNTLRRIGFKGHILSFEPVESTFAQLEIASHLDNDWQIFRVALGAEDTNMKINRTDSSEFSSFLNPNTQGKALFPKKIKLMAQEDVQVTTLASLWPQLMAGIENPRVLLKMDTQGFDLEVLSGAEEVLEDILVLQSEVSIQPIYKSMPNYKTALSCFEKHGFELSGMFLVSRDKDSLRAIEYDCVMLRSEPSNDMQ